MLTDSEPAAVTHAVFLATLAFHVVAGATGVISGALAAFAGKRAGRHPVAGRVYVTAMAAVFATATVMAARLPLWNRLPGWSFWLIPAAVGIPLTWWALARLPYRPDPRSGPHR